MENRNIFLKIFLLAVLIPFQSLFADGVNPPAGGSFHYNPGGEVMNGSGDFITNSRLYNANTDVRAIVAAIEQRGTTAGKIWALVIYSADVNSPDTFKVYYSLTAGQSWQYYWGGNIRPGDKVNYNDADLELMENNTGQKYLWVTFGYRQGGSSGPLKIGGFIMQVPSLNGVFFNEMSWPGADSTKNYYDIHITSDNARYPAAPYVYLACSFDSLDGSGSRIYGQKFARNLTPYSLVAVNFSYTGHSFYWGDTSPASYRKTVYTDAAYFHNGGQDSVIISFSGARDSTKIYFAKCDRQGNPPVTGIADVGGSHSSDWKTHARLSSNGNDNGNIVCTFRQLTAGIWNVKYFSSANFGNFSVPFSESQLLGSAVNSSFPPDIAGTRNGSTHYISFITSSSADSLHYISLNHSGLLTNVSKMNYYNSLDEKAGPRALFSYSNNDSCLAFYTEEGPSNLLSAAGCGGEPIGIINLNNGIPQKCALEQNYPNPFNPVTSFKFSIAGRGAVTLAVYDMLGRKIETLVNSRLNPGTYKAEWNGSGFASGVYYYRLIVNAEGGAGLFSRVRKMVLVK